MYARCPNPAAIFLLNLFLAFLQPKFDPSMELDEISNEQSSDETGPKLPVNHNEEFKPFVRRLPEFHFWYVSSADTHATLLSLRLSTTNGFLVAFFCTCFSIFDIPVFWPILLVYFILLFSLTMRRQIRHMIKYRYIPFSIGSVFVFDSHCFSVACFLGKKRYDPKSPK